MNQDDTQTTTTNNEQEKQEQQQQQLNSTAAQNQSGDPLDSFDYSSHVKVNIYTNAN